MPTTNILIVGMGGLGVPASIALARHRGLTLTLLDPDPVELSNLPRQILYRPEDIGRPKVDAAAGHLRRLNPELDVRPIARALDASNALEIIGACRFVIDGTDNPITKFLINDICVGLGRPFAYGGVVGLTGQALTVLPGASACLRCLFETPPNEAEIISCREAGILGPTAGIIGIVQAREAITYCQGGRPQLVDRILTYDGRSGRIRLAPLSLRAGCGCGEALPAPGGL